MIPTNDQTWKGALSTGQHNVGKHICIDYTGGKASASAFIPTE